MKYAVISDIHANLEALEAVLDDARSQGAESVVCLGDIVGYGPKPFETLGRVKSAADIVIAGNHDDAVAGRLTTDDFIDVAAEAVKRHREALSNQDLAWLRSLPYTAQLEGAIIAHGDFTNPPAFNYMMDQATVSANFNKTFAQLMFVGHTHVPGVYLVGNSGKIYRIDPEDFTLEPNKRYIVNPGSVGYPREAHGQCFSSYVLYDSTASTIRFRLLPFSIASILQRGTNPRSVKRRLIVAASVAAALVAGTIAYLLAPSEQVVEKEVVVENVVYSDDPALVVESRSLTLSRSVRNVRAGLTLERRSAPAHLRIDFKAADGSIVEHHDDTVINSANRPIKVPVNAVSASFTVRRMKADSELKIKSFSPSCK